MPKFILLVLLAGVGGWAAWRSYGQQHHLRQQLAQLTTVLTTENDLANLTAQNTIKSIEAAAAKNRNQPTDLALLHQAEALQTCVNQLVKTLRTYGTQLRRATGNQEAGPLGHSSTPIGAGLGTNTPRRQALEHQLATYAAALHRFKTAEAATAPLPLPSFEEATPVAEALADLGRLENQVLTRQTQALRPIAKAVGARRWLTHPLAIAAAESNVVAPGGTYRAELRVVRYFSANELPMHMTCNGRPVPTGPNGVGLVSFRAPTKPGPASWVGKIRINANGRDTTFVVRVPLTVGRR